MSEHFIPQESTQSASGVSKQLFIFCSLYDYLSFPSLDVFVDPVVFGQPLSKKKEKKLQIFSQNYELQ